MSHTASTNGARHNYQRPDVMIFERFWESKHPEKSEDFNLAPGLYSFKTEVYEERFGVESQFKRRGNIPFPDEVLNKLKEKGLI